MPPLSLSHTSGAICTTQSPPLPLSKLINYSAEKTSVVYQTNQALEPEAGMMVIHLVCQQNRYSRTVPLPLQTSSFKVRELIKIPRFFRHKDSTNAEDLIVRASEVGYMMMRSAAVIKWHDAGASLKTLLQDGRIYHQACLNVMLQAYAELLEEEAIDIPAWFTFASKDGINVVSGDSIFECASIANACKQVVAVGINCTPSSYIQGLISSIRKVTSKPIVIYPNSGEAYDGQSKQWIPSSGRVDEECAEIVIEKWREAGASLFGGCCRTTPNTIRAISKALSNKSSAVNDTWLSSENEM